VFFSCIGINQAGEMLANRRHNERSQKDKPERQNTKQRAGSSST